MISDTGKKISTGQIELNCAFPDAAAGKNGAEKRRCVENDDRDFRDERRRKERATRSDDDAVLTLGRQPVRGVFGRAVVASPRTSLRCHSGLRASPSRRRRRRRDDFSSPTSAAVKTLRAFVKKLTRRARHPACSPPPRRSPRFRPPRAPTSPRARAWLSPL